MSMLKKIYTKGFKGFKNGICIDLSNVKSYDFNTCAIRNSLVNKGIIYGKNASGKSNVGYAIFDIVSNLSDKNNGKILSKQSQLHPSTSFRQNMRCNS